MDEKKRIEDIKSGLTKSVYEEAARIKVKHTDDTESTERLSNILEGYVDRINTIEADNMEELEEGLRVLKKTNVEVGDITQQDELVKQYNDYIHNDLDRTIAETVEYTYNLNNKTDDLNDILIRPMENEEGETLTTIKPSEEKVVEQPAPESVDTDELFEIEATTDLGVLEDIVELESDPLDIAGTEVGVETFVEQERENNINEQPQKEKVKKGKNKKAKNTKKPKKNTIEADFEDEKGLAAIDIVLIGILIIIFIILIALVAKVNGVF